MGSGIQVLHSTPGRVRARVESLKKNPTLAPRIHKALATGKGVKQVHVNPTTGSVLVIYTLDLLEALDPESAVLAILAPLIGVANASEITFAPKTGLSKTRPQTVANVINTTAGAVNAQVASLTDGVLDLKMLFPIALFAWGLRTFATAEKFIAPPWYNLLWYGFTGYMTLNVARAIQQKTAK